MCCCPRWNLADSLSEKDPGKVRHTRWLTSCSKPFTANIYFPKLDFRKPCFTGYVCHASLCSCLVFYKTQPGSQNGSVHLWQLVHKSRQFPDKMKTIINQVISTNGYLAHHENILLGTRNQTNFESKRHTAQTEGI